MSSSFDTEYDTPDYENLAKLAEDMVFRLPGCADVMIRKAITSAYRDFCKRTCVLRTRRTLELESGTNRYFVAAKIADCIVDCVVRVEDERRREVERWAYSLGGDYITFCDRYLPSEDDTRAVDLVCVEIPRIGSERAPSRFIDRFGDAIVDCALCELYAMSGKPWSDAGQSTVCGTRYENALTEARARHHGGGTLAAGGLNFYRKGCLI